MRPDLFVAADGSDANHGSSDRPLATIHHARDRIRALKRDGAVRDIVVEIAPGTYYLESPVRFDHRDSGINGSRIVYRAGPGGTVRVVGGKRVTDWERAGENTWRTSIGKDNDVQQIFDNGERRYKTRLPCKGYLRTAGRKDDEEPGKAFYYNPNDIAPDIDLDSAQVYIWGGHDWFTDLHRVVATDRDAHRIQLSGTVVVGNIEARAKRRYCLYNLRALLGQPGHFYVDRAEGYLYYTPCDGSIESREIVIPLITHVIEFHGQSEQALAENITVEGILLDISSFQSTFCETRDGDASTYWNEPVNRKGLVHFENAVDCELRFCEVRNAGYAGVCLNNLAQCNIVHGCKIHQSGYHGILLAGYNVYHGRLNDNNKRNRIEHNWIHHCGRLVGHGAGIFGHSSGENRIAHNLIHDMPRYGICFKNWHYAGGLEGKVYGNERVTWENHWDFLHARHNMIEHNEVHHVNQDSEDSGAISFISCGRNNVVNGNLIHHCPRHPDSDLEGTNLCQGIYLDDAADFFVVTNNIIHNLDPDGETMSILIFAKGIGNEIKNNVLVGDENTKVGILLTQYDKNPTCDHRYGRNIITLMNLDGTALQIGNSTGDLTPEEQLAECDFNLYHVPGGASRFTLGLWGAKNREELSLAEWTERFNDRYDGHSLEADPRFVDPERADYSLREDSPAWGVGFQAIDFNLIGPQDNPFCE